MLTHIIGPLDVQQQQQRRCCGANSQACLCLADSEQVEPLQARVLLEGCMFTCERLFVLLKNRIGCTAAPPSYSSPAHHSESDCRLLSGLVSYKWNSPPPGPHC